MSVVIVGGNDRMVYQYEDVCKSYGCKAKVFVKENGALKKKLVTPDHEKTEIFNHLFYLDQDPEF